MSRSRLPPAPDFHAIDASAHGDADDQEFLRLIGTLSLVWSNNESMLIYVIMLLLEIDEVAAAVIFTTLNTTRARVELVNRLAAIKISDAETASALTRLIKRFQSCTQIRNEIGHSTYILNGSGQITHTHLLKLQQKGRAMRLGETRAVDAGRIDEISGAIRQLKRLNRDMWAILPSLKESVH